MALQGSRERGSGWPLSEPPTPCTFKAKPLERLLEREMLLDLRSLAKRGFLGLGESPRFVAESEGFEPSIGVNLYALSRGAPSTTRPTLRYSGHAPKTPANHSTSQQADASSSAQYWLFPACIAGFHNSQSTG